MNKKISVIVPVYKTEKFIRRCVESVLRQTYTDLELLLVDDGSPDRSGEICDEYICKDERVKVIHKSNGGVTSARACGVSVCTGAFVIFVDSDDYLLENSLELLYYGFDDETDIVIGSHEDDSDNVHAVKETIMSPEQYQNELFYKHWNPWGKLYRRSLFTDAVFDYIVKYFMARMPL